MQRLNSLQGNLKSQGAFFFIILLSVAADQFSKLWIRANLALGESRPEEGILRLTHVTNDGIIFGLQAPQALSIVTPIIIVIAAFFLQYRYSLFNSGLTVAALGLIIGGSIGNLIDRIRFSNVTDFIDLRLWGDFHWPVFNLADSALVFGIILLIYFLFRMSVFQSIHPGKE